MVDQFVFGERDLDPDKYPRLTTLWDTWAGACDDACFPRWSDVDFLSLHSSIIPYFFLIDVLNDPLDFRFRFYGTGLVEMVKQDYTGQSVSEIVPADFGENMHRQYSNLLERRKPQSVQILDSDYDAARPIYATVRLPFSDDGKNINKIMGAIEFDKNLPSITKYYEEVGSSGSNAN